MMEEEEEEEGRMQMTPFLARSEESMWMRT